MATATTASSADEFVADEPFFSSKKLKFMCSFGGKIVPRSNDGTLRYVGGDKRIVSMRKEVTFAELMHKMVDVFGRNVVLKYQLPGEDLDALITVTCDEDLENMVDEYDKVAKESGDPSMKMRVFLFSTLESELSTGTSHLDAEKWDMEFGGGGGGMRMNSSVSGPSTKNSNGLVADLGNENGAQEGMVSGSLRQCSNTGLVSEDGSRLVSLGECSNLQPDDSMDINVGSFPPSIMASVRAGYDPSSYVDLHPKGFNYVNYVTGSGHVQHVSSQPVCIGGTPEGLVSVSSCSYFPVIPANSVAGTAINSVPPSPSSLLDGLIPSTLRLESVEESKFGRPTEVHNDPNLKAFQSISQRPPFPPPSMQTSNANIYGGMYMWPQAPLLPTWAYQGNAERLDNHLICPEVLPHAHSDPLVQDLGIGTMVDAPESSTAFCSLQNLEIIRSHAPCEPSTLTPSNDAMEKKKEGIAIGSKRGTSGHSLILKGQSESGDATLHRAVDVGQSKIPLSTGISDFLSVPNEEVEASHCPHQMTRVISSNDSVEQKNDGMGRGSAPQPDSCGYSQASKARYYNDVISLQMIENFYQNKVPLPAVPAGFPADLVPLYGLYPSHLPQTTYLNMSQQHQQYPHHLVAGHHLVLQDLSTTPTVDNSFLSRNGVLQTSEPSNRDVRTELSNDRVIPVDEVAKLHLNTIDENFQNEKSEFLRLHVESREKTKYHVSEGESIWSNDKVSPPTVPGGTSINPMQLPSLNCSMLDNVETMDFKKGQVLLEPEPPIPHSLLLGVSSAASRIPDAARKEQNPHLRNGYNAVPFHPVSNLALPFPNLSNPIEDTGSTQTPAPLDLLIRDLGPQQIRQNADLSSLQLKRVASREPLVSESYIDNNSGNACELLTSIPSEKRDYDKSLDDVPNKLLSGIVGPLNETQITKKMLGALEEVASELKHPLMVTFNGEKYETASVSSTIPGLHGDNFSLLGHKKPMPQVPALNHEAHEAPKMVNTGPHPELGKDTLSGPVALVAHLPKPNYQKNEHYLASNIVTEHYADDISPKNAFFSDDNKVKDVKNKELEKKNPGFQASEGVGRLQIIKNSDLEELRELGSGTFGTVYHGKWRGTDVAIKRINERCFAGKPSEEERLRADFWNEACNLADLHHPNVVAFYGVVIDGPGDSVATVTEYMVNGSLLTALQRNDKTFDQRKRLLIAMDAAFGMEYLHGKNIVHFDLKCDNLLVNLRDPQRPICKVGDLGLSKVKCQTLISGGVRGTLPWMAPELLNGLSSLVSEKVDVFSFGIVLWEILTGEEPYADLHYGTIIGGIVNNTLRPPVPDSCDPEWRSLMEKCWSADPCDRPSFTEIASTLRSMAASSCEISKP